MVIWDFVEAVEKEVSLLDTNVVPSISAASAVSINDKGIPEWVTIKLVPIIRTFRRGKRSWGIKVDGFMDPPPSKVLSLGAADDIVHALIDRDAPDVEEASGHTGFLALCLPAGEAHNPHDAILGKRTTARCAVPLPILNSVPISLQE